MRSCSNDVWCGNNLEHFSRSQPLGRLDNVYDHPLTINRAAIEEDYAKRLSKLAKTSLGKDEIGDLKSSLENVLTETAQQASYHLSLSNELRTSVEAPTTEFSARLSNLKKGLQASVEKSYRNKGLQEGHFAKVRTS